MRSYLRISTRRPLLVGCSGLVEPRGQRKARVKGTKTERSPGVWRPRVFVGTDPATGNPHASSVARFVAPAAGPMRHWRSSWPRWLATAGRPWPEVRPRTSSYTAGWTTPPPRVRRPPSEATDSRWRASSPRSATCAWTRSPARTRPRPSRMAGGGARSQLRPPAAPGAVRRLAPGGQLGLLPAAPTALATPRHAATAARRSLGPTWCKP